MNTTDPVLVPTIVEKEEGRLRILVKCPFCREIHVHGGQKPFERTHRGSHCGKGGYYLVP